MSYYKTWMDKSEDASNRQEYVEYIQRYYALEKVAYEKILGAYPNNEEFLNGTAAELAKKLNFPKDAMDVFVGFVDGIKSSLSIKAWNDILTEEKRNEITREYREANMAHSDKIGRNDPCPCGSGKKYKNCCGKKG